MKHTACWLMVLTLLSPPLPAQSEKPGAEQGPAREVALDPLLLTTRGFALTLRANDGNGRIEMIVGFLEGQSIEMARRGQKAPRPLTHDIFKTFLDRNGWKVERMVVRDLVNGTFLADLVFQKNGQRQIYDARPSDAIALALRSGARIFVAEKVFELMNQEGEKNPEKPRPKPGVA